MEEGALAGRIGVERRLLATLMAGLHMKFDQSGKVRSQSILSGRL